MSRFIPVSLAALFAICTASTAAFAGAVAVPEPSSLALLAGGVGVVYLARKFRGGK